MVRILNGAADTLSFTYNGNQDVRNDYDAAGYLSRETPSGIEYSYNFLKRPEQISHLDYGPLAIISYLADGTKFHVQEVFGNSWSGRQRQELFYIGSLIFTKNQDDEFYLYNILTPEGRIIYDEIGGWFRHQYSTDRIGSVRADIVDGGDDWDENDYLAYGTRMPGIGYNNPENRWRFNGKEEFRLYSIVPSHYLDYGARWYDPHSCHWLCPDPLAEKNPGISPYAFCNGDPVNLVDREGEFPAKVAKSVYKVSKATYKAYRATGKVRAGAAIAAEAYGIVDDVRTIVDPESSGWEIGLACFDLLTGFGDEAKKGLKVLGVANGVVEGGDAAQGARYLKKNASNFRKNLARKTGNIPQGTQAHHIFPQKFREFFEKIFNIDDPEFGVWLETHQHESKSYQYNKRWEDFWKEHQLGATQAEIEAAARDIMLEVYEVDY